MPVAGHLFYRSPVDASESTKKEYLDDVILVSSLLILNIFHFFSQCLYCWFEQVNVYVGLRFVLLIDCDLIFRNSQDYA